MRFSARIHYGQPSCTAGRVAFLTGQLHGCARAIDPNARMIDALEHDLLTAAVVQVASLDTQRVAGLAARLAARAFARIGLGIDGSVLPARVFARASASVAASW